MITSERSPSLQKIKPGLSLCAIVKDEAHCLEGMLISVVNAVDEIIIVDTGSTDKTKEIALAFGAHVVPYEWTHDFAAARNYSLSLATREWVVILDADERLDLSCIASLRSLITEQACAYFLNRYHYTVTAPASGFMPIESGHPAQSLGAIGYFSTHDLRLFPNDPRIVFSGAVHESPEDSIRHAGIKIQHSDVILHHYGNLAPAARLHEKAEFYLSLAEQKAHQSPDDWRGWFQLGVEFQSLGRHREATTAFERATKIIHDYAPLWRQLGISYCNSGEFLPGLQALQQAFVLDESCPITWNAIGAALLELGHFDHAENCFQSILAKLPQDLTATKGLEQVALRRTNAKS